VTILFQPGNFSGLASRAGPQSAPSEADTLLFGVSLLMAESALGLSVALAQRAGSRHWTALSGEVPKGGKPILKGF
jgi:hypothetical protein